MVHTFRVVIDVEEDVFRDVRLGSEHNLEDLYKLIISAFDFKPDQMASFYLSNDEWEKGHEIGLMDMGAPGSELPTVMSEAILSEIVLARHQKMLLVHDFMRMWCFYVECIQIEQDGDPKPKCVLEIGKAPDEESKSMDDFMLIAEKDGNSQNDFDPDEDISDLFDDIDISDLGDDYM